MNYKDFKEWCRTAFSTKNETFLRMVYNRILQINKSVFCRNITVLYFLFKIMYCPKVFSIESLQKSFLKLSELKKALNLIHKDNWNFQITRSLEIKVEIYYPENLVTSKRNNQKELYKDFYITFICKIVEGKIKISNLRAGKFSLRQGEFQNHHIHSHVNASGDSLLYNLQIENFAENYDKLCGNCCIGSGAFADTFDIINAKDSFSKDYEFFLLLLDDYISQESAIGTPYTNIKSTSGRTLQNPSLLNLPPLLYEKMLLETLEVLEEKHIQVAICENTGFRLLQFSFNNLPEDFLKNIAYKMNYLEYFGSIIIDGRSYDPVLTVNERDNQNIKEIEEQLRIPVGNNTKRKSYYFARKNRKLKIIKDDTIPIDSIKDIEFNSTFQSYIEKDINIIINNLNIF
jgi:hypothetical protein